MATRRTELTELGTAVGLVHDPSAPWPDALSGLEIPGLPADVWQPVVLPAARTSSPERELLLTAIGNGHAFRTTVLGGRRPGHIAWTGSARTTWTSDIPRDITVDGVWFIQAKYDSTCVLNTSPSVLVDHLLVDDGAGTRRNWYEVVAPRELQAYWRAVRGHHGDLVDLPADVRDLDGRHRATLKSVLRSGVVTSRAETSAYAELCRAVSIETELRWEQRLRSASVPQRTQMLFRMLRIAGGPYWLLGTKGAAPVRLAVSDTRSWRDRFELRRFEVRAAGAGQPQVDWEATVTDLATGAPRRVQGYCEIRWSHGKLHGNPECKVQVLTPLTDLPGYEPMSP